MIRNIIDIQKEIDDLYYWDAILFDLYSKYCGDEMHMLIENDEKMTSKISCIGIEIVSYKYGDGLGWKTHKMINGINAQIPYRDKDYTKVRDMKVCELSYYAQKIEVTESKEVKDCYRLDFDFSILAGYIVCREIEVEKVSNEILKDIFWKNNKWDGWEKSYLAKYLK